MLTINTKKTDLGNVLHIMVNGEQLLISGRDAMLDCLKQNLEQHSGRSLESILTGNCPPRSGVTHNQHSTDEKPLPLPETAWDTFKESERNPRDLTPDTQKHVEAPSFGDTWTMPLPRI